MKDKIAAGALILLALGIVAGAVRALDLIGADTLRLLALVLAVPVGVGVMALCLTPLVRAWRTPTIPPVERHVIRETRVEHTLDNRAQPVPGPAIRPVNLYPGLHSAEWRAGLLDHGQSQIVGQGWSLGLTDQDAADGPLTDDGDGRG